MTVTMQPVKSSNILSVGLNPETGEMHVAFVSGGSYVHSDVSPDKFNALLQASSVGEHYHKNFRGNAAHAMSKKES